MSQTAVGKTSLQAVFYCLSAGAAKAEQAMREGNKTVKSILINETPQKQP